MRILITFLGRVPKGENGYRATRYDFGDGAECKPVAFFGWILHDRYKPDRMVILGTAGSMWDHLFEGDFDLGDAAESERLELMEKVQQQKVEEVDLRPLEPVLAERLGCEVRLRIIPYCRTEAEQVDLLRILAENVEPGAAIDLDITHGFRHLPMLGFLSALHLRKVLQANVDHIWYGAYDPDTNKAPVHDLVGLLKIADWLEALSAYEHTGDYGVFSRLLNEETGKLLAEASFFETVNRIGQARTRLRKALQGLDQTTNDPAFSLFRNELRRRIGWAESESHYLRQRKLAYEYLERGRYLDATLIGWEAFVTRLQRETGKNFDPDNYAHRKEVCERFEREQRTISPRTELYRTYDSLRRLRNAIAHGSQPKGAEVQRALSSAQAMKELLEQLFAQLLPESL